MSIFNPGTEVSFAELRGQFNSYYPTDEVSFQTLNSYYHGGQNNLGWYQNKAFRRFRLINNWLDTAGTNPSAKPTIELTNPYSLASGSTNLNAISPKLLSHNNYTVTIAAITVYGWTFAGWYSGANGSGTLLTGSYIYSLSSSVHTTTYDWYGYHVTFSGTTKCLDGDSSILMADGSYKKVKDLQSGELIKSKAVGDKPNTGFFDNWQDYVNWNDLNTIPALEDSNSMVDEVLEVEVKYLKVINNGMLKMALTHPVLVKKLLASGETGWTVRHAFNIEVGDIILGGNSKEIEVTSAEQLEGNFTLYDLRVLGNDTIYVNNIILPVSVV